MEDGVLSSNPGLNSPEARNAHQMSQPKTSLGIALHAPEWGGGIASGQEQLC